MKKDLIKIIRLYVYTEPNSEHGIGVRVTEEWMAYKSEKRYCGDGIRLSFDLFETPLKVSSDHRIAYDIYTTENNRKQSVQKCMAEILLDFKQVEANFNNIKMAVEKMPTTI